MFGEVESELIEKTNKCNLSEVNHVDSGESEITPEASPSSQGNPKEEKSISKEDVSSSLLERN